MGCAGRFENSAQTRDITGQTGGSVDPNGRIHNKLMPQGKNLEEEVSMRGQG